MRTTETVEFLKMIDENVESVRDRLKARSEVGIKKYGVTTDREDIDLYGWLQHLQDELLDAAVYVECIKKKIRSSL